MLIDFGTLSEEQLSDMYEAGQMVGETMRVLQKSDSNVVGEILKTTEKFVEWDHVPSEDVYDSQSASQYYYHAHEKSDDGEGLHDDEHGHFHTFIRGTAMPGGTEPAPLPDLSKDLTPGDINTHVIGISMRSNGTPFRLFTVNRWVTGETWFEGKDIVSLLGGYEIDDTRPSWPLNLWITNMIRLFRPQIEALILERDTQINAWKSAKPDENIYEDRTLEVMSYLDIDLSEQIDLLEAQLNVA